MIRRFSGTIISRYSLSHKEERNSFLTCIPWNKKLKCAEVSILFSKCAWKIWNEQFFAPLQVVVKFSEFICVSPGFPCSVCLALRVLLEFPSMLHGHSKKDVVTVSDARTDTTFPDTRWTRHITCRVKFDIGHFADTNWTLPDTS